MEVRREQANGRAKARREREKVQRIINEKRNAKLKEKEEKVMGKTRA